MLANKNNRYYANLLNYLVFIVIVLFFIGPIIWLISLSLKNMSEVYSYPPALFPDKIKLEQFAFVLTNSPIPTYLFNSFKITVFATLGILLVCIPGAYAFSRFNFKGRGLLLLSVLSFQMIAPVIIVVPLYTMMDNMGLLDTHSGLILVIIGAQVPFSIWLLKGFLDSIPHSIDESAMIDGASRFQTLLYVILPTAAPGLAAVVIFNFIFGWSEFVMSSIIISSEELLPFSVGIFTFQSSYGTAWNKIAAASVIGLIPILIMYISLQKFFVAGLTAGAVKE